MALRPSFHNGPRAYVPFEQSLLDKWCVLHKKRQRHLVVDEGVKCCEEECMIRRRATGLVEHVNGGCGAVPLLSSHICCMLLLPLSGG